MSRYSVHRVRKQKHLPAHSYCRSQWMHDTLRVPFCEFMWNLWPRKNHSIIFYFIFVDPLLIFFSAWAVDLFLSLHSCLSLAPCQSVPRSPVFPYVTGAHIRENNLWWPWIRDAVEFPMILVWYGNSLKYLDSGGLSDHCSPACC